MRVAILGASGIIGQHMRLCVPDGVEPYWFRRKDDRLHIGLNLTNKRTVEAALDGLEPDVVVNLAGEANTDKVERDPTGTRLVNVSAVETLANWCRVNRAHLVQVSTQAVFSGENPPYHTHSPVFPVNEYGRQKVLAEALAKLAGSWTIARPTFVLGRRPLPHVGRANPIEQFPHQSKQVDDRWFSISYAEDVAAALWKLVTEKQQGYRHLGIPGEESRYTVARNLGFDCEPCSHDDFKGLAPRPRNTAYSYDSQYRVMTPPLMKSLLDMSPEEDRVRELSLFFGHHAYRVRERLSKGFGYQHQAVADDFRAANPQSDEELLEWYRTTDSYVWELTAYHLDSGFNYAGQCRGIIDRLKDSGVKTVLCLGDGIGDLTLALHEAGFQAHYHDLKGSRTADYAAFRFWRLTGKEMPTDMTDSWDPDISGRYDAIVSLDFFEHVTDVPAWVEASKEALNPGGLLVAQNAFGMGSGRDGSIPCHLARNDRFVKDWDPLLFGMGFKQESSNWYSVA